MPARKLVLKNNTKLRGQHRCNHCGKDIPTAAGLKLHIANSKNSGCRDQWEREVLRRDPKPPKPPNDVEPEPLYDSPMLELSCEEVQTFIPSERQPVSPNVSNREPQSKRARVEEVDDEEAGGLRRWVQEFEGAAAEVLAEGKTLFDELREQQEAMCEPPLAPFADEEEWELAQWLMKNVTQTATDQFLKSKGVSCSLVLRTAYSYRYTG